MIFKRRGGGERALYDRTFITFLWSDSIITAWSYLIIFVWSHLIIWLWFDPLSFWSICFLADRWILAVICFLMIKLMVIHLVICVKCSINSTSVEQQKERTLPKLWRERESKFKRRQSSKRKRRRRRRSPTRKTRRRRKRRRRSICDVTLYLRGHCTALCTNTLPHNTRLYSLNIKV